MCDTYNSCSSWIVTAHNIFTQSIAAYGTSTNMCGNVLPACGGSGINCRVVSDGISACIAFGATLKPALIILVIYQQSCQLIVQTVYSVIYGHIIVGALSRADEYIGIDDKEIYVDEVIIQCNADDSWQITEYTGSQCTDTNNR